jgi:thiopeptide-type bacteriocin biosynthesis protein
MVKYAAKPFESTASQFGLRINVKKTVSDSLAPTTPLSAFVESGFFVLRTPLLPFDEFVRWGELPRQEDIAGLDHIATAQIVWEGDIKFLRQRLREIVDRPEIRYALYIGSPSLEASIDYWIQNPDSKKGLQTERALVRYFGRMTGRPTPFGLFSGCSVGASGNTNGVVRDALLLQSRSQYRLSLRLDFQCIAAFANALRTIPEIAEDIAYRPNSSLHKTGDIWHYLQLQDSGPNASYSLVKIYNDKYLEAALTRAQNGCRIRDLRQALIELDTTDAIESQEATTYIQELIEAEVLVAELAPSLTHEDPLSDLISQLDRIPSATGPAHILKLAKDKMSAVQELGLNGSPAHYNTISAALKSIPGALELTSVFQVDMIKPQEALGLSNTVVSEFKQGIELLIAMGANASDMPRKLNGFRERFRHRYGHAWKPLADVLDEETGIGVDSDHNDTGSKLIRELGLGRRKDPPRNPLREPYLTLLRKLVENSNQRELLIEAADFPALDTTPYTLPDAFSLVGSVVAKSTDAIRCGDFKVILRSGGGPSGASMLGRFCNADPELNHLVQHHLRREESMNPNAIYAEVVHLPQSRMGNILQRPVLRDYEIAYLGRSGAAADRQIPVSDLWVTVTSTNEILLYSERLKKRIIPRLTAAHAFNQRRYPSVYRFLGYLQYEHSTNVPTFAWGPLESLPFLPRVTAGRTVLSLARWRISQKEVEGIVAKDRYSSFLAMQELRQAKGLPQWISFIQRDENLPVDLDNALSVDAFVHVLKRAGEAVLQEMYPSSAELCVSGPEGRFQHEILIPFIRQRQQAVTRPTDETLTLHSDLGACTNIARRLPPGSDWVFFKIYAGPATLDELLRMVVPSVVRDLFARGLISRWFFIRFEDPDLHLRLRFQSPNAQLAHAVLRVLEVSFNPQLEADRSWKIEVDTYEREIERYGGVEAMSLAEDIFFADSDAVLEILQSHDDEIDASLRWKLGLIGVDMLLTDFGLAGPERTAAVQMARERYEREFRVDAETKIKLGQRFRKERKSLEILLRSSHNVNPSIHRVQVALKIRSERVRAAVRSLRELGRQGRMHVAIEQLVLSYIHMHIIRLMREEQRAHELVIYDFLYRIYEGVSARQYTTLGAEAI